jgi:hypothetical protein
MITSQTTRIVALPQVNSSPGEEKGQQLLRMKMKKEISFSTYTTRQIR